MPVQNELSGNALNGIIRRVECTRGTVTLEMTLDPRFAYGHERPRITQRSAHEIVAQGTHEQIRLQSDAQLETNEQDVRSSFLLRAGEKRSFVLAYSPLKNRGVDDFEVGSVDTLLAKTVHYWQEWSQISQYRGQYGEQLIRSALTLKLLTYKPSGGIVAAPTTSLPERIGGVRNWDYRFTWLRDSSLVVDALFSMGHFAAADSFADWIGTAAKVDGKNLQIMYGLAGERDLTEKTLDHLEGYRGSRPVRIGNAAVKQSQLDAFGEILLTLDLARQHGRDKESPIWGHLEALVNWVCEHWHEPDHGIWEVRSPPQHFVYSKAMAWVAIDRGITAAMELGLRADFDRWRSVRAEIKTEIMERGWNERIGSFVQAYGSNVLDAANLRLSQLGFISAHHPKMKSTVERTLRGLTRNGLVYRYLDAEDGLPQGEATFAICTFWMIQNLADLGRLEEAKSLLDRIISLANDVGLLAEEIDPITGQHLGNFPQAFSHVGLIAAVLSLEKAQRMLGDDECA